MALPALMSGADCGPVNPLQALSKQFERDRGVQQDHFGPGRAGPSREVFRTQSAPAPGFDQEASRFFSGHAPSSPFTPQHAPNAFDLSALRGSLPSRQQVRMQSPPSAWAGDFLSQKNMQVVNHQPHQDSSMMPFKPSEFEHMEVQPMPYFSPINSTHLSGAFGPPMHSPLFRNDAVHPGLLINQSEVNSAAIQAQFPPEEMQQQQPEKEPVNSDELARTAGLLVETVKNETNPKFQNSAFLGLMRQLRDREVVVEGTDMVNASTSAAPAATTTSGWAQDFANSADVKGKGKARDMSDWADTFRETSSAPLNISEAAPISRQDLPASSQREHFEQGQSSSLHAPPRRKSVHFVDREEMLKTGIEQMQGEIENEEDRYWRQENADYQEYWQANGDPRKDGLYPATAEWGRLQDDWDRFEATAAGIKPVSVYQFQPNNPYVLGESSTRHHAVHTQRVDPNQSFLEKEAAVQNDMQNPVAWFELGVKQQENEREAKAIQALRRAVELDPSYLEAWLALAISNTNENDRNGAYDAIEHWIRNNRRYEGERLINLLEKDGDNSASERHETLIQCLVGLARAAPEGEVDADIQTALGVLLNTSEDYEKAQDCFRSALDVRPNDWLLYNRVGATLANSGRANEALWFYYRALELNPSYIRARFNLGISCINMKRYEEAAEHILDALVLQENDTYDGSDKRGVTSSTLWDCLRTTCVQMQRMELATMCDEHDLEEFRRVFWT